MNPSNEPLEAEPVAPHEIPLGPRTQTPPHRDSYGVGGPQPAAGPQAPGAFQSPGAPQGSATQSSPNTLDYASRGSEMWEFWTAQWWRRRRNLMSAGLALFGLGLGLAMSYWVVPGLLMGAGGFLVGQAMPIGEE